MLKKNLRIAPVFLGLALASAWPLAHGQTGTTSNEAASMTEGQATSGASSASSTRTAGTADERPVQNLLTAAQSLREGIQKLSQTPPGERRTEAMRESNAALQEVQNAIAALPPHLLTANADEATYNQAMDKLRQASDRLHVAANALANQPEGPRRQEAAQAVNRALLETNEAMLTGLQLSAATSAGTTSGSSATGDSASGASASASDAGAGGSATVTGRPGANTVELGSDNQQSGEPGAK